MDFRIHVRKYTWVSTHGIKYIKNHGRQNGVQLISRFLEAVRFTSYLNVSFNRTSLTELTELDRPVQAGISNQVPLCYVNRPIPIHWRFRKLRLKSPIISSFFEIYSCAAYTTYKQKPFGSLNSQTASTTSRFCRRRRFSNPPCAYATST